MSDNLSREFVAVRRQLLCFAVLLRLKIGSFVEDVTTILAEEQSEAAKRYLQSAAGKSFSRKRATSVTAFSA